MANRYRLNHSNLDDILKSEEVMALCRAVADDIVAVHPHPEDLEIEEYEGRSRVRVSVKTASVQAHIREARDHGLVQALGAVQRG